MAKKQPSRVQAQVKDRGPLVTQSELARMFGVSVKTIGQRKAKGELDSAMGPGGRLYLHEAMSAIYRSMSEQLAGRAAASEDLDPVRAGVELKRIQAKVAGEEYRIKQAKAELIEGQTVHREAVALACTAVVAALRQGLESLPVEVNAIVGGIDAHQAEAIRDAVHQKLNDCADDLNSAVRRVVLDTALNEESE